MEVNGYEAWQNSLFNVLLAFLALTLHKTQ